MRPRRPGQCPPRSVAVVLAMTGAYPLAVSGQAQIDKADSARDPPVGSDVVVVYPGIIQVDGKCQHCGLARDVMSYAREHGVTIALENGPLDVLTRAVEEVGGPPSF